MIARLRAVAVVAFGTLLIAGCAKDNSPTGPTTNPQVTMTASFSTAPSGLPLLKVSAGETVDSLRIDSAIVVIERIKFESHIDSVSVDSTGMMEDIDSDTNVMFRGPFVIHVRDTVAINFASQTLPAGTYDGIKFKIHRLQPGEAREDSDEREGHSVGKTDSLAYGSSVMVWGSVRKNGVWVPFTLAYDGELEFKIKGNFVVSAATSNVQIALNFNMLNWFRDPNTGQMLDPTDTTMMTRELFREAIQRSFHDGHGGRDMNHDGHPDD